jgi:hypothetical protein
MRNPAWLTPLLWLLAAGCSKPPLADQPSPLKVEIRRFEKVKPGCGDREKREQACFSYQVVYPEVMAAPLEATRIRLNAQIQALLQPVGAPLGFDNEATQLEERYASREAPAGEEEEPAWFVRRTAEVVDSTAAALAVRVERTEYLGGAGGTGTLECINLNPATGLEIRLEDLVVPGGAEKLRALGEARFRSDRRIPAEKRLSEAGYTFPEDRFVLPKRFLIRRQGLEFIFNAQEISPEANGPAYVTLRWVEAGTLMRREAGVVPGQ